MARVDDIFPVGPKVTNSRVTFWQPSIFEDILYDRKIIIFSLWLSLKSVHRIVTKFRFYLPDQIVDLIEARAEFGGANSDAKKSYKIVLFVNFAQT